MIKCLDLVGVFLIIFVKSSMKDKIKNFDHAIIKTGLMGTMGNKGSCLIRFNYMDTTLAFSCGHLAAGSSALGNRINEIHEILNKNFPLLKDLKFFEHDIAIIFGDLNFRIDVDFNTCLEMIRNKSLHILAEYDQLNKVKQLNSTFSNFLEGNLNFNPTYKYVKGTNDYDSKRKRVPSWCDRILYKKSRFINQSMYDRAELLHSDHRPIFSIFTVCAYQEIKEEKAKLIKEIKKNLLLDLKPHTLKNVSGNYKDYDDKEHMQKEANNNKEGIDNTRMIVDSTNYENPVKCVNNESEILKYFK